MAVTEVEIQKVEIEQVGGCIESCLFELKDGGVAYIADIAITNQTSRTIDLIDLELRTPWDDKLFRWLLPVEIHTGAKRDQSYSIYRFPGGGPEFAYKDVINHHLVERKTLPGKRRLAGWLLGIGGFMPDSLVHGQLLKSGLTVYWFR